MGMTVNDLKEWLSTKEGSAEVMYFDSEMGEDIPMIYDYLSIKEVDDGNVD
jgi:hypothetical protein